MDPGTVRQMTEAGCPGFKNRKIGTLSLRESYFKATAIGAV
jgi:hypothetical protein